MLNYNKIISLNQQFAENHYGIKRFGNGQVFDLVLDNQEAPMRYPVMWMEDLPSPIETGLEHFAFRVWFLAQVEQLENREDDDILVNANEVKSDMKQLGIDFLSYWKQDSNYKDELRFEITTTWNYAELVQPDELTGGYFDVAFKVKQMFNRCIVPMGTIMPPENSCLPVNFLIDGVQSEVIQSGTDFDLTIENQDGNTPDYAYNSATDTLTVQTGGGDCNPVTMTFNTDPITSSPSGGSKAIVVRNSDLDPVGFAAVDTASNLTVNVGNSEVEINDSAGGNLYTVSVKAEGAAVQTITDSTVLVKNSAGTTLYTKTVKAQGSANQIVADTAVSNSDDTYTSVVVAGVPKELPDITVTQPNGDTSSYPSVKNFACTLIAALLNADLISDLTEAQIAAVFGARHTTNVITKTTVGADSYSKPANLLFVDVICIGGGGGGASGARKGPGVLTGGGGGGSTGAVTRKRFLASDLASTETLTIGAGGQGGAANSADDTDQNPGTAGGSTSFGTLVVAAGGNPGVLNAAGATTNRLLSEPSQANLQDMGGIGANGGASGVGANGVVMSNISYGINYGGGGGGGLNAANTQVNGGNQPRIYNSADALNAAAGAGTAGGGNGGDGSANYALQVWLDNTDAPIGYGISGGGGGSANAAAGGRGGDGGLYGAAGGGGGASRNGNLSGRGGHGSQGAIIIVEHLAV